jgi:DNA-binding sugar fermentation-stimulating protein
MLTVTMRQATSLIQQGVSEVSSYLLQLMNAEEITADDYYDSEFTSDLREAVKRGLEADLTGDETSKEVRELTQEIINEELS